MSLWSKLEPICKNIAYGESFPSLIDSKKYGYFSQKVHGISGYYDPRFVVIVLFLLKRKDQCCKKIFQAILIRIDSTPFQVVPSVFKRDTNSENLAVFHLASNFYHAELEKQFPEAVAKHPTILSRKQKLIGFVNYIRIDTIEEKYPTTLSRNHVLKGKISLDKAIEGHYKIAIALDAFHKKSLVHADIKNWNVFVLDSNLLLFDFDFARSFPCFRPVNNTRYVFWDSMMNDFDFLTPMCDVFGWSIMLATVIWGKQFHSILQAYSNREAFDKNFEAIYLKNLEEFPKKEFYSAAYKFICSIFVKDRVACAHVKPFLNKPRIPMPQYMLAQQLYQHINPILPNIGDCLTFIRPWVISKATSP